MLNRQFMDFCLRYKIKNKSDTNAGLHPRTSRALGRKSWWCPLPALRPGRPRWPGVTPRFGAGSREAGGQWLPGTVPSSRREAGFPRERALSAWKWRRESEVPGEVGSNFQIIGGWGGGGGNWRGDSPPPSVEFSAGNLRLLAPRPLPLLRWPFPPFFSFPLPPPPRCGRWGWGGWLGAAPARVPGGRSW